MAKKKTVTFSENKKQPKEKQNTTTVGKKQQVMLFGPPETKITEEKVAKVELFDFIREMYKDESFFIKKTLRERGKFYFMINRFMSMIKPGLAEKFSRIGINNGAVVSYWFYLTRGKFKGIPEFMYTSTKSKATAKDDILSDIDPEIISLYCRTNEIDMKTFLECKEKYPQDLRDELEQYLDKDPVKTKK